MAQMSRALENGHNLAFPNRSERVGPASPVRPLPERGQPRVGHGVSRNVAPLRQSAAARRAGAEAQRSDPKTDDPDAFPTGFGAQGDDIRILARALEVHDTPAKVSSREGVS